MSTASTNTSTTAKKTLFLVGPGLIGGSLLVSLRASRPDLELHALSRSDEQAASLSALGIHPVRGTLDDHAIIKDWAARADIVIHTASADDDKGVPAIMEGLTSPERAARRKAAGGAKPPPTVYIQTSGNDELVRSARGAGLEDAPTAEGVRTLGDVSLSDEQIDARIKPDAYHRHVDGPLREELFNPAGEKEHDVVGSIMMPPLIYGIGAEPWKRLSIQTPMITQAMMDAGELVTLPEPEATPQGTPAVSHWNCIWVHDLVRAYEALLAHLEGLAPGEQATHYVFPAEEQPFSWKAHFDAVGAELKRLGHPAAAANGGKPRVISTVEEAEEFIGGEKNPYADCFGQLIFGTQNSFTRPELLKKLGFKWQAKGVVDSILNGKELEDVIGGAAAGRVGKQNVGLH